MLRTSPVQWKCSRFQIERTDSVDFNQSISCHTGNLRDFGAAVSYVEVAYLVPSKTDLCYLNIFHPPNFGGL